MRRFPFLLVLAGLVPHGADAQEPPMKGEEAEPSLPLTPPAATGELPPEGAPVPRLATAGETCGARSDCHEGLRCLRKVCVDRETFEWVQHPPAIGAACNSRLDCREGLHCLRNACVNDATFRAATRSATQAAPTHGAIEPFVGGAFGASLPFIWESQAGVGFEAAFRTGFLISGFQLKLEITPASTVLLPTDAPPIGRFGAVGSAGYLIPLSPAVSWVLRVGGGGGGAFGGGEVGVLGYGELRLDFVGVAVQTSDHLLVEVDVPSYRLYFPGDGGISMAWVLNVGIDYLF